MSEVCHCGRPLHYTDPDIEAKVRLLVADLGRFVRMTVGGRTWLVDRHYIALHGVKAVDIPTLGFEEVTEDPRR